MLNLYGLKIKGLEEVSEKICNYDPSSDMYDEVFYNSSTGEVWAVPQCKRGNNNRTVYHDKNILRVCKIDYRMSTQDLVDGILNALVLRDVFAWEAACEAERDAKVDEAYCAYLAECEHGQAELDSMHYSSEKN